MLTVAEFETTKPETVCLGGKTWKRQLVSTDRKHVYRCGDLVLIRDSLEDWGWVTISTINSTKNHTETPIITDDMDALVLVMLSTFASELMKQLGTKRRELEEIKQCLRCLS